MGLIIEINLELSKIAYFVKFHNTFFSNLKIVNHKSINGYYQLWGKQADIILFLASLQNARYIDFLLISSSVSEWNPSWEVTVEDPIDYLEYKNNKEPEYKLGAQKNLAKG